MNREKVLELVREVGAGEPESLYGRTDYVVMTVGDLERFANLVEKEVRGDAEPVAWMYTLEYGDTVVDKKVSLSQLNYPFGVCGADYLRENSDGMSYVRQTLLYAQPVLVSNQTPVAWMCTETKVLYDNDTSAVDKYHGFNPTVPLYTHPVRQPLTDDQITLIIGECAARHEHTDYGFARAIEAAHGIGGTE